MVWYRQQLIHGDKAISLVQQPLDNQWQSFVWALKVTEALSDTPVVLIVGPRRVDLSIISEHLK